ncbi:MAG: carboxypeptidase M32 [Thermoplasmata archaeon]|nr:carboxypeptidase M32 [Thermoplasmata archaeon]
MDSYKALMDKYRELVLVDATLMNLNWDLETHMPPQGITLRSDQLAVIQRVRHRMLTSDGMAKALAEAEKLAESMDQIQKRNLYLIRREHDIAKSIPEDLVAELQRQSALAWSTWVKAKAAKDWKMFEPELKKLVDLSVRASEATMAVKGVKNAFDAMIDDHEEGMTQDRAASLLADLKNGLLPLIRKYTEASKDVDSALIMRPVPIDLQRNLVRDAVNMMGYDTVTDKARGAVDETEHPFTIGYFDDVRITVHYHESDPLNAFYSGLHEGGHALYELNRDHDWMYQPVGSSAGMGVHEAMSRFPENMLGRSRSFWRYYLPRLNKITKGVFSDLQVDDIVKAVNKVEASKTRVTADEMTYQMHVIIRFEIERKLFRGELEVSELPQAWNELYDKYLQIKFDHDGEGVLQDVHWSIGSYGYFQSYSMGNVYAGMFLKKMEENNGSWLDEVEKGNMRAPLGWLAENVHRKGALFQPQALIKMVTGTDVTVEPFVKYLEKKHSDIW